MPLTKEQKRKIIEDLKEKIGQQKMMIFVDFKSLKVKDLFDLRKRLRIADGLLTVAKKTLLDLAFKERKLKIDVKKLAGQLAIIFGFKDEIKPAKIVYQFSQENKNLKILGGFFENKFREAEEIITLAQLPTREELLAKLTGSIRAPISGLINVLEGNLRSLVYILSIIKK